MRLPTSVLAAGLLFFGTPACSGQGSSERPGENAASGGQGLVGAGGERGAGGSRAGGAGTGGGGPGDGGTGGLGTGGAGQLGTGGTETGGAAAGGNSSGGVDAGGSGAGGRASGGGASGGASGAEPPTGTIRVFYLHPSDVPFEQRYPDGIGKVMLEAQNFFLEQLGKTFFLNDPIVEVVVGEHEQSWYENTPAGGEKYWWSATNAQQEIARRFDFSIPDPRWIVVSEVSAEGEGAGGGALGGWVLLPGHDADGAAGYPAEKARWVGGMVHELGHAFGLPDSASLDGTCMSAALYEWPDCTFTQSQKDIMLGGNWGVGSFLH